MSDKNPKERIEYVVAKVTLLESGPSRFDHDKGEPAAVLTIGRRDSIEALAFDMADARMLATAMLITLATYGDEFARKLLDGNFPADDEGKFKWP